MDRPYYQVMHVPQSSAPRAAVIGAGLAGAACAERLAAFGWRVTVFDKARGAGGRASTRRRGHIVADHGAQFFSVRSAPFRAVVDRWLVEGVAKPWPARVVSLGSDQSVTPYDEARMFVGVPGMSALARSLLARARFVSRTTITSVSRGRGGWTLRDARGESFGPYDAALVAVPPVQAVAVAKDQCPLVEEIRHVPMAPCWAAVAAFRAGPDVRWDAAHVEGSALAWVARNGSKPGRPSAPDVWTLHARPDWSSEHLEEPAAEVARQLLSALAELVPMGGPPVLHLEGHRWRYARPLRKREPRALFDSDLRIGFCGDWTGHARVESAVSSGIALARAVAELPGTPDGAWT
jgi:predicted NAD/FAD-dependent oxidoreductase